MENQALKLKFLSTAKFTFCPCFVSFIE